MQEVLRLMQRRPGWCPMVDKLFLVWAQCALKVCHKGSSHRLNFYIVYVGQNIIGLKAAVELNLTQLMI